MIRGRPLEYDPDTVLDAAMQLFWQQGYEATSLQDLLHVMRLSKSSLYQAYGSKHNLFLHCIKRYHKRTMDEMHERLNGADSGAQFVLETLSKVISEANELANPKGCLMTNTASEFAQSNSQVALQVAIGLDGYREMFRQAVEKGQQDETIRPDMDSNQLANYLVTNMSGLRTMVKAGTDKTTLQQTVGVIISAIQ